QPELASDSRFNSNSLRSENKEALRVIIVTALASLNRQQVIDRLEKASIANASVNTMHDVWAHPQLAKRARWTQVDTPVGPIPALFPPGNNTDFQARMDGVPALGQQSQTILAELGLSPEQIQGYSEKGII